MAYGSWTTTAGDAIPTKSLAESGLEGETFVRMVGDVEVPLPKLRI